MLEGEPQVSPSPKSEKTLQDYCNEFWATRSFKPNEVQEFAQTIQNRTLEKVVDRIRTQRDDYIGQMEGQGMPKFGELEFAVGALNELGLRVRLMKGGLS